MDYMEEALKEAKKAYLINEVPVGCIIVQNNKIIGRGHNQKEKLKNALMHAEIIAINDAMNNIKDWRLTDCEMYVTLEPCLMCCGAILQSRIKQINIGALEPKGGSCISKLNILDNNEFNHKTIVNFTNSLECSEILKKFFRELRFTKKNNVV